MAKETETRSAERYALAAAIANVARTEADLRAARDAADKACDRFGALKRDLLSCESGPTTRTADTAAAFLAAMNEGRDASVAEL